MNAYKELWLKAVEIITNAERERIIKLLDSNDAWLAIDAQSVGEKENTVEGLIALIKGENK